MQESKLDRRDLAKQATPLGFSSLLQSPKSIRTVRCAVSSQAIATEELVGGERLRVLNSDSERAR